MPTKIKQRKRIARGAPKTNFIREWRLFRKLSQDKLVAKVRERLSTFSKSTLSRVENGHQDYTQPMLEALGWALDATPADLIERAPNNPRGALIGSLKRIPDSEIERLARIIGALETPDSEK